MLPSPLHPFFPNYLGSTLLIGERSSFKSATAFYLAAAIAGGHHVAGLPIVKRPVYFESFNDCSGLREAYSVIHGRSSDIREMTFGFYPTCDHDGEANLKTISETARELARDSFVVLDDVERLAGTGNASDNWLAKAVSTLFCNLRNGQILATLNATPDDLNGRFRALSRQFENILRVERCFGDYFELTLLHGSGPEAFSIEGTVSFAQVGEDETGNELRYPVLNPALIPAHNARRG